MALIFAPSTPMPQNEAELEEACWYVVWDEPVGMLDVLSPGAHVFLYDRSSDVLVWEVEVTETLARPFEHVDDFRKLLTQRWGQWVTEVDGAAPAPGWGIGWKAKPVARIDLRKPDDVEPLAHWETTWHLDDARRDAFGLPTDVCPHCPAGADD